MKIVEGRNGSVKTIKEGAKLEDFAKYVCQYRQNGILGDFMGSYPYNAIFTEGALTLAE